jgi:hypothetical protein
MGAISFTGPETEATLLKERRFKEESAARPRLASASASWAGFAPAQAASERERTTAAENFENSIFILCSLFGRTGSDRNAPADTDIL